MKKKNKIKQLQADLDHAWNKIGRLNKIIAKLRKRVADANNFR